jgi:MYXO-CTERM domain-containing protein
MIDRVRWLALGLVLCAGLARPVAAATVAVPYAPAAPAIGTGVAWWSAPSKLFDFDATYAYGDNTVTVYGQWHEDALYLAAKVDDPLLYATHTPRDSALTWENDGIELLFDPTLKGGNTIAPGDQAFRQYIFTIAGGLFDAWGCCGTADASFNGNAQSYPTIAGTLNGAGTGYVMEMKVPWTDLGLTPASGLTFGFDLVNDDKDDFNQGSPIIEADWAQLSPSFAQPGQWNRLQLTGGPDGGVADAGAADADTREDASHTPVNPGADIPTPKSGCSYRAAAAAPAPAALAALAALLLLFPRRRRHR